MNRSIYSNSALPRAFLGYDRARVDRLMQDMSDALTRTTEEKIALAARLRDLETRFAAMKERETAIQEALAAARQMGDEIRAAAQKEAQLILDTARLKAGGLLQNANARLVRVMGEAAEAQKNKTLFEMKLRGIIDDHLRLLDMNRQKSASLEAAVGKLGDKNAAALPDRHRPESGGP